jgi:hypothetical protein
MYFSMILLKYQISAHLQQDYFKQLNPLSSPLRDGYRSELVESESGVRRVFCFLQNYSESEVDSYKSVVFQFVLKIDYQISGPCAQGCVPYRQCAFASPRDWALAHFFMVVGMCLKDETMVITVH